MQTKVFVDPAPCTEAVLAVPVPDDLTAHFEQPDMKEVTATYVTRLYQGAV